MSTNTWEMRPAPKAEYSVLTALEGSRGGALQSQGSVDAVIADNAHNNFRIYEVRTKNHFLQSISTRTTAETVTSGNGKPRLVEEAARVDGYCLAGTATPAAGKEVRLLPKSSRLETTDLDVKQAKSLRQLHNGEAADMMNSAGRSDKYIYGRVSGQDDARSQPRPYSQSTTPQTDTNRQRNEVPRIRAPGKFPEANLEERRRTDEQIVRQDINVRSMANHDTISVLATKKEKPRKHEEGPRVPGTSVDNLGSPETRTGHRQQPTRFSGSNMFTDAPTHVESHVESNRRALDDASTARHMQNTYSERRSRAPDAHDSSDESSKGSAGMLPASGHQRRAGESVDSSTLGNKAVREAASSPHQLALNKRKRSESAVSVGDLEARKKSFNSTTFPSAVPINMNCAWPMPAGVGPTALQGFHGPYPATFPTNAFAGYAFFAPRGKGTGFNESYFMAQRAAMQSALVSSVVPINSRTFPVHSIGPAPLARNATPNLEPSRKVGGTYDGEANNFSLPIVFFDEQEGHGPESDHRPEIKTNDGSSSRKVSGDKQTVAGRIQDASSRSNVSGGGFNIAEGSDATASSSKVGGGRNRKAEGNDDAAENNKVLGGRNLIAEAIEAMEEQDDFRSWRHMFSPSEDERVYLDNPPTTRDVESFKGNQTASCRNDGNKLFRKLVHQSKNSFASTKSRSFKTSLSKQIIGKILETGARFVKKDGEGEQYYLLTVKETLRKTSKALNDAFKQGLIRKAEKALVTYQVSKADENDDSGLDSDYDL